MKIDGVDVLEYQFWGKSSTVIPALAFEEMEACIAANITWEEYQGLVGSNLWLTDTGSQKSKCDVLVWYRYHKLYPLVLDDIAARKQGNKRHGT